MSKVRRIIAFFGSLVVTGGLLALPHPAAPQGLGLDVSPAKFELAMSPGLSYNLPMTVHNSTGGTVHVAATMVDFGVAPNGDYQIDKPGTRPDSLMKWATINPREFDLPGGTSQVVRLSWTVPATGVAGEYAGIVFFQTRPPRGVRGVAFAAQIASKIYLTIPDTLKIDGAISAMSAADGVAGELYHVEFKNTGNAHEYLRGQIEVRKDGVTVDRLTLPSEVLVERGGTRIIEVTGKHLPAGKYEAIAIIDYGGKTQTGGSIPFSAH